MSEQGNGKQLEIGLSVDRATAEDEGINHDRQGTIQQ